MTDPIPEFTDDDLDVLQEALEAWEAKDVAGEMGAMMIDSIISRGGPTPDSVLEERRREKLEREQSRKVRKERSVLLRAKLIQIRDRRIAGAFSRSIAQ